MKRLTLLSLLAWFSITAQAAAVSLYYPAPEALDLSAQYYSAPSSGPSQAMNHTFEVTPEAFKMQVFGSRGSNMMTYVLNLETGLLVTTLAGPATPTIQTTIAANYCPTQDVYITNLKVMAEIAKGLAAGNGASNAGIPAVEPLSQYLTSAVSQAEASCR